LFSANYSFAFANGALEITKAAPTTTITNAAALAANNTTVGQAYAVNWSVVPVSPSTAVPLGAVAVHDNSGGFCSAPVGAGTCNLVSTSAGVKNIVATYGPDGNMTGSTSSTTQPSVPHTVVISITGNVNQFGTNANLAGVTITLTGSAVGTTLTDANGNYAFAVPSPGGTYVLTPSGLSKTFEPVSRTYTNVTANITNADFTAYNDLGPGQNPRNVRAGNTVTAPGSAAVVPVVITSRGNEVKVSLSLSFDIAALGIPAVTCGSDVPG